MFIHPTLSLLSSRTKPRINEEIKKVLKLSDQVQTGDWNLYQNYIELWIFGCELAPYKLPKFLPMRIFALEYIKKMLNMDEIHFVAAKKKYQFKIKTQIGPFIFKNMAKGEEVDKLLKNAVQP